MKVFCYPKINIFLKVKGILGDRHRISTRLALAYGTLFDIMEFEVSDTFSLCGNFDCELKDNLIYKAVLEMQRYLLKNGAPEKIASCVLNTKIDVVKNINTGSGLGGGSSNAAATLIGLNNLYNLQLDLDSLLEVARNIDSDSSFFVSAYFKTGILHKNFNEDPKKLEENYSFARCIYSANATARGEIIKDFIENDFEILIFNDGIKISTKEVYSAYDKCKNPVDSIDETLPSVEILNLDRYVLNDLLKPALSISDKLQNIDKDLDKNFKFSGSGSSYFKLI